jgi:hypothetical protein
MYSDETDYVKNIRNTHCKGCMNEGDDNFHYCDGKSVINCYLRRTYIPEGEWQQTSLNDIRIAHCRQITESINKQILEKLNCNNL